MSQHHDPPGLPVVTDEAADSPRWLPLLGLALLGAMLLVLAVERAVGGPAETTDEAPAAVEQEQAAGDTAQQQPSEPEAIPLQQD